MLAQEAVRRKGGCGMPKWVWWLTYLGVLLESVKLAGFLADGPMELMLDAGEYWRLSDTVMTGDLFMYAEPIAYRTPVYPWFLSAIRLAAGQYGLLAVIVLQALLVVGTSVLAGAFARQISRRAVAMPITVTVMLFGVARVLFARAVLTETLFTFLLMLHLVSLAGYLRAPSPWRAIGGGLTFGILLLTRPVAMLLWVVHLVLFLWPLRSFRPGWEEDPEYPLEASERWTQRGVQLRDLVIAGAVGFLIATPWILRNRAMFERPVVTEFTGRNLWIVTFQDGAGAGLPLPETPEATDLKQRVLAIDPQADLVHNWSVSRGLTASGLSDVAVDQLMMKVARQAIDGGRIKFAERAGRRFVNFYRCAATDLPKSVGLVGDYQNQWVWHRPIPGVIG